MIHDNARRQGLFARTRSGVFLRFLLVVFPLLNLVAWIAGPKAVAWEGLSLATFVVVSWQPSIHAAFRARRLVALQRVLGIFLGGSVLVALAIEAALWTRQLPHIPGWLYFLLAAVALPTLALQLVESAEELLQSVNRAT